MSKPTRILRELVKALANAPATAVREMLNRPDLSDLEKDEVKRIARAIGIKTDPPTVADGDPKTE